MNQPPPSGPARQQSRHTRLEIATAAATIVGAAAAIVSLLVALF